MLSKESKSRGFGLVEVLVVVLIVAVVVVVTN